LAKYLRTLRALETIQLDALNYTVSDVSVKDRLIFRSQHKFLLHLGVNNRRALLSIVNQKDIGHGAGRGSSVMAGSTLLID
jgi:hypothetical protein